MINNLHSPQVNDLQMTLTVNNNHTYIAFNLEGNLLSG